MNEKNVKCRGKKYTILYCVFVRTFAIPFYYGSGTVTDYGSGSDFLTSYGSSRQKVTISTVPVSPHCISCFYVPFIRLTLYVIIWDEGVGWEKIFKLLPNFRAPPLNWTKTDLFYGTLFEIRLSLRAELRFTASMCQCATGRCAPHFASSMTTSFTIAAHPLLLVSPFKKIWAKYLSIFSLFIQATYIWMP